MGYELTSLLNRCTKDDVEFFISTIDSYFNFTDDKELKLLNKNWDGRGTIPLVLNHKIEKEIRYLGSNDLAYARRKLMGYVPAGVSIDEIIDDLCELLKIEIPRNDTLEARLEIFAGKVIDDQFSKLSDERKRQILEGMDFDKHHLHEIIDRVINKKEMLLPVILPLLAKPLSAELIQVLIINIIALFIGEVAARQLVIQIVTKFPVLSAWLGPLALVAGGGWMVFDITGPASRKTIPLVLYLGVLSFRDGATKEFTSSLAIK